MNGANEFELFGLSHIAALATVLLASGATVRVARYDDHHRLALPLAAFLIAHEIFKFLLFGVVDGSWDISVPLDLCRLNALLAAYLLIRRSYAVFEISYFWAMAGSTAALLNPDVRNDFPDVRYFTFFIGHAAPILVVIYAIVGFGFRPTRHSLFKALLVTGAYALVIAGVNYALNTNYLFLREKPQGASVLDHLGPWPYYVLWLLAMAAVACVIGYLPFAFRRKDGAHDTPRP